MRAGRPVIILVLVVALVLTAWTRRLAESRRSQDRAMGSHAGTSLSSMNSYALALLLGGLRGPLVMVLWPSSESQKSLNDLEDFDTKVEWIRLLQADFDSVHLFQVWNKAYNISVKMTTIANKYSTILDALDYAHSVDRERPNNINLLAAIGGIFVDKLGGSSERNFYRRLVRDQSIVNPDRKSTETGKLRTRRTQLDPVVDEKGFILPELLKPTPGLNLQDASDPSLAYDGSDMQFLKKYEPFPFGVSPLAIGYNYYMRARALQKLGRQQHAQLSDLVLDSRPAIAMKGWAEEEWENGRRAELEALGKPADLSTERAKLELVTAAFPLTQPVVNRRKLDEAIDSYRRGARVAEDSKAMYDAHTAIYPTNKQTYLSHIEELRAIAALCRGDANYLSAMTATDPGARQGFVKAAIEAYQQSLRLNEIVILRYFQNEGTADKVFPPGTTRANIDDPKVATDAQLREYTLKLLNLMATEGYSREYEEDIRDYVSYLTRARTRLDELEQAK